MRSGRPVILSIISGFVFFIAAPVWANVKEIKLYKEAFPDAEKPKCIGCHMIEKPKKEGDHELNEYGKKIQTATADPTVEAVKKVGPIQ